MRDEQLREASTHLPSTAAAWGDVPLITRLELVKAGRTIAHRETERLKGLEVAIALYKGDSNGAGAMLRCVDKYAYDAVPIVEFTEEWAYAILRENADFLKGLL